MNEDNKTNLMIVLGNCFLFGMFGYAVFILGYSGWWFAFPCFVHFSKSDLDKSNVEV